MPTKKSSVKKIDDYSRIAEELLNEKAKRKEYIITDVAGISMYPTLITGDKIAIDASLNDKLSVGDIIAFINNSLLVCHRIVRKIEKEGKVFFITKGDSMKKTDNMEVSQEQIAGKVIYATRGRRRFNPYNGSYYDKPFTLKERIEQLVGNSYSFIKTVFRKLFLFLGIYLILKRVHYFFIKKSIVYEFQIPRDIRTHPSYRFATISLKDIWDAPDDFFKPLNRMGGFKITARRGSGTEGYIEVIKCSDISKKEIFWAATSVYIGRLFTDLNKDYEFMGKCYYILDKIGVKTLYALVRQENNPLTADYRHYIANSTAKFIKKVRCADLYLLEGVDYDEITPPEKTE